MKTIITLNIFQLLVILFLLVEITDIEGKIGVPAVNGPAEVQPATLTEVKETRVNTGGFDESLLRRVVREELRAQLDRAPSVQVQSSGGQIADTVSEEEYQYRLDASLQNLDYYIKQGEISDAEMAELQAGMAALNQEGRRQMLSLISKALSSGELKGHF